MRILDQLKFDSDGLVPAVVQDAENGDVLMVGWMNREAVERTLREGKVCFWSRSRQKFWVKGETSGHFQLVKGVYVDCDQDCLLVKATQIGAACHDGYRSCFYREIKPEGTVELTDERLVDPEKVYGKSAPGQGDASG
jgi:phosphoribosyl-AMP cyclohydrolase